MGSLSQYTFLYNGLKKNREVSADWPFVCVIFALLGIWLSKPISNILKLFVEIAVVSNAS